MYMTEIKIPVKAHDRRGSKGVKAHNRTIKVRDYPLERSAEFYRDRGYEPMPEDKDSFGLPIEKDQVVYANPIDDFGRVEEVEKDKVVIERNRSPKYGRFHKRDTIAMSPGVKLRPTHMKRKNGRKYQDLIYPKEQS